jgi:FtsH-binding integral membrane protein
MLGVYAYMASGFAVTAIVAHLTAQSSFHHAIIETVLLTPFVWPLLVAPLGLTMLLALSIDELGFLAAEVIFWGYALLVGFSVDCVVMVYTGVSIAPVFLAGAVTFATLSFYGGVCGRAPSDALSFLVAGLCSAGVVGIVGFYLSATAMEFALAMSGVALFVALSAWDRQRIEDIYRDRYRDNPVRKLAVLGALALYLDASVFPLLLQLKPTRRV